MDNAETVSECKDKVQSMKKLMKEWKKGVQEVISDFFSQKMLKMDFSADRQKEFNNMEKKLTKALQVAPYQLQALYVSMSYREHSVDASPPKRL